MLEIRNNRVEVAGEFHHCSTRQAKEQYVRDLAEAGEKVVLPDGERARAKALSPLHTAPPPVTAPGAVTTPPNRTVEEILFGAAARRPRSLVDELRARPEPAPLKSREQLAADAVLLSSILFGGRAVVPKAVPAGAEAAQEELDAAIESGDAARIVAACAALAEAAGSLDTANPAGG